MKHRQIAGEKIRVFLFEQGKMPCIKVIPNTVQAFQTIVHGAIACKPYTKNCKYIEEQLKERYGDKVLKTTIPDLNEADTSTFMGVSLVNAAGSRLGKKFRLATDELLLRMEG